MNTTQSNQEEFEIDLSQVFYILTKNIAIIMLISVLCADIGYAISTYYITPTYTASADMLVNNKQYSGTTDNGIVTSSDITASSSLVSTYSVILKSHTVLEQVIDTLDLDYSYNDLAKMVSVTTVDNTQVMRVTVRNSDPQVAMDIVTQIISIAPSVIVDKAEVGSVKTVDQPWSSGRPVSPDKRKYILLFAVLGFLGTSLFFVLRELLNNTFKTEQDVTRELGLPILGVIPLEEAGLVTSSTSSKSKQS